MKRVNIQADVESRQRIATISSTSFLSEKPTERIEPETMYPDEQITEVPGCEDHPTPATEQIPTSKRGRKTKGNL